MVSDALVQFGVGFADAFGRERRPYFDALAREEANKEITMGRNLDLATNIVSNSAKIPKEQQESVAKQLGASLNTASLYQVGALQAQGIEIFNISDKGAYSIGNNKFASISPLKPKNMTEADKERNTAIKVITALYSVSDAKARRELWASIPLSERALATEYILGESNILENKFAHAERRGYIAKAEEFLGTPPGQGKYIVGKNPSVDAIIRQSGLQGKSEPDIVSGIIKSQQLDDEILDFYANYLGDMEGIREIADQLGARSTAIKGDLQAMVAGQTVAQFSPQPQTKTSSTDVYSVDGSNYLKQYNTQYFIDNISDAYLQGYNTRSLMLSALLDQIIMPAFDNNQWITGDRKSARNAIMQFISDNYDEAAGKIVQ